MAPGRPRPVQPCAEFGAQAGPRRRATPEKTALFARRLERSKVPVLLHIDLAFRRLHLAGGRKEFEVVADILRHAAIGREHAALRSLLVIGRDVRRSIFGKIGKQIVLLAQFRDDAGVLVDLLGRAQQFLDEDGDVLLALLKEALVAVERLVGGVDAFQVEPLELAAALFLEQAEGGCVDDAGLDRVGVGPAGSLSHCPERRAPRLGRRHPPARIVACRANSA